MANSNRMSPQEVATARERRLVAMKLQEIEDNPLAPEVLAIFEMFEREAWQHDERKAYLDRWAQALVSQ